MFHGSASVRGPVAFALLAGLVSPAAAQTESIVDTDTVQPALADSAVSAPPTAGLHKLTALAKRHHRLVTGRSRWNTSVTWGASALADGQPIERGASCAGGHCDSPASWQSCSAFHPGARNIVRGLRCDGADCMRAWSLAAATDESVGWATSDAEIVVSGTSDDDESVVLGTSGGDSAWLPVVRSRP